MPLNLRRTLKDTYFKVLSLAGGERVLLRRLKRHGQTLVLNFHRVSPVDSPFWPPLAPEAFDEVVGFLKQRLRILALSELSTAAPHEPAVVLSFDDGYLDFVEYAAPILRRHGVRANMNVIPTCVESGLPIWNVRLYDALAAASPALIAELRVPGFTTRLTSSDPLAKARFGARLSGFVKKRARLERAPLLESIEHWLARVEVPSPTRMMRVHDVKEMAQLHEIGVHAFDHDSMGYEDDAFFTSDLDACFRYFGDTLGIPLSIYAFPNGSYRQSQIDILLARGIQHVLLVDEKIAAQRGALLPRLTIATSPRNTRELRLRALGHLAKGSA